MPLPLIPRLRRWWQRRARVGARGERIAARHLRRAGYRVLARNLHLPAGEIDLLATTPDGRTLVVAEVKTNADPHAPLIPELRVGPDKQRRLTRLGVLAFRRARKTRTAGASKPVALRFDVLAVTLARPPRVRHHRGAFQTPF